ncbi:MAG: aldo/keto reductase [Phycisphaeraceae bacterium]|nr:aldo/keto reductase [Phycisphaeraceae bacterium]
MDYRPLAKTDLKLSLLGFGNFTFGANWWGDISDQQAIAMQNAAVDAGVNFFDSAPAYGEGRAELLLKETIRYAGRDRLVISTKFGYDLSPGPSGGGHRERPQVFTADFIRRDLEQSLARMDIDCVDFYQAHNLKLPQYSDELFETMQRLIDEGKIRSFGIALGPAIGWREEGYEAFQRGAAAVQTVFNLYEQDPGREFCELAVACGSGVIARVPTNSGILDEEFTSENHKFPANDHRKFRDRNWLVYGLKKNAMIKPLAAALGLSVRQFAFKWLASQPGLISIEPNIVTLDDIAQFTAAADGKPVPTEVLTQLTQWYDDDFALGEEAHPCDWKSSVTESGTIRSAYQKPPVDLRR